MPNGVQNISQSQTATYTAEGLAQDYSPIITNISPEVTPFLSKFKDAENAVELSYNWLTESLKPPQENAHLEIENYETKKVGGLTRLSNTVQFLQTTGKVSDAMRKTKKEYNQQDELPRQVELAFKQHAKDLEYIIASSNTSRLESGNNPALCGGIPYFMEEDKIAITFNATGVVTAASVHNLLTGDFVELVTSASTDVLPDEVEIRLPYYIRRVGEGTSSVSATEFYLYNSIEDAIKNQNAITYTGTNGTGTGTFYILLNNVISAENNVFTEDDINDAMQLAFTRGGVPSVAVMSGLNKRRFSQIITGSATKQRNQTDTKVVAVTDVYQSDFGTIEAMSHPLYKDAVIDLLDMNYWAHKWFVRPHQVTGLAKKGSYEEFVLESAYGFQATQPLASARIKDIKRTRSNS